MDNVEFEVSQRESDGYWQVTARFGGKAGWALRKTEAEAKGIALSRLKLSLNGYC